MAENLLEVGRIGKANGLRGDVFVRLYTDRVERLDPGTVLQTDRGPLEVESTRPQRDRFVVHFVGVDSREAAEEINGVVLLAEPIDDPGVLWVHELVGCVVVDADGVERGVVEALQDNPASDLLVLDNGALVPLRFVTDGPTDGRIHVDTPPGLFDL